MRLRVNTNKDGSKNLYVICRLPAETDTCAQLDGHCGT
jgi:hypothetical protein